jgi:hypothetical protein
MPEPGCGARKIDPTTLEGPLDWPDATVASGDAADVARLKEESEVPLRSHGSLPVVQGRMRSREVAGHALV